MLIFLLVFWETCILLFIMAAPTHSHQQGEASLLSTPSPAWLFVDVLMMAILMSMVGPHGGFDAFPQYSGAVEHLFMLHTVFFNSKSSIWAFKNIFYFFHFQAHDFLYLLSPILSSFLLILSSGHLWMRLYWFVFLWILFFLHLYIPGNFWLDVRHCNFTLLGARVFSISLNVLGSVLICN